MRSSLVLCTLLVLTCCGFADKTCMPSFDYCAEALIESKGITKKSYLFHVLFVIRANSKQQVSLKPMWERLSREPVTKTRAWRMYFFIAWTPVRLDMPNSVLVVAISQKARAVMGVERGVNSPSRVIMSSRYICSMLRSKHQLMLHTVSL